MGDIDEEMPDRWKPHEHQWKGPRPTHPRDVPAFLGWWRKQNLDRIAIVVDICDKLGYEVPKGARGELLLEKLKERL